LTKILFRISTIDYQARRHELDFVLTPYYDTANLTFANAQKTLALTYKNTTLELERNNTKTSGLDPGAIRSAMTGFGTNPLADPQMPIASKAEPHLSVDAEGLVANADGTYGNLSDHFLIDELNCLVKVLDERRIWTVYLPLFSHRRTHPDNSTTCGHSAFRRKGESQLHCERRPCDGPRCEPGCVVPELPERYI
jgi:hypothetical protein